MKIGIVNLITTSAHVLGDPLAMFHIHHLGPHTDAELNITVMARQLAERGNEVQVMVSDAYLPAEQACPSGNPMIKYLPTRMKALFPPALMPFTPSIVPLLRKQRFDIVQTGELFQTGTVLSWLGKGGSNTKLCVWQELDVLMRGPVGRLQSIYYRSLGRAVMAGYALFIPRSLSARQHLLDVGIEEDLIGEVAHSGVNTSRFIPMARDECRAALGIPADRKVILVASRLDPIKGLDILIQATAFLRKEVPESLLVIQGHGPAQEELRGQIARLGLEGSVMLITKKFPHEQMPPLFNAGDVLAITSRTDLFPFTAVESISCGVPLATSFGRGLKTDIVDKGAGVMLRPDPEGMATDLADLLRDESRLRQLGQRGRDLAVREFDFRVCADRLLGNYEVMLSGGCKG